MAPMTMTSKIKISLQDFPSNPVVKTLPSNAGGLGSIPGQKVKIPHASRPKKKKKNRKQKTEAIS